MIDDKKKYVKFCDEESKIPIFSQYWWLDAVCGYENWDVVLVEDGNGVIASMPYYFKKKYGMQIITMPILTQNIGPYIKYPDGQKYTSRLAYEKVIMNELIKKLPKIAMFSQNFHYNISNWLPFYWNGYKQTTRYTYTLDLNNSDLFQNFSKSYRQRIIKLSDSILISESNNIEDFYKINTETFTRQGISIPYSLKSVERIYNAITTRNSGKIFIAKDENSLIHSQKFVIWDKTSAYTLMGGTKSEFRSIGSETLLYYRIIEYARDVLNLPVYDFLGSMIEGVENRCRSFGARQTPYYNISKINSKILTMYEIIRKLVTIR